MTANEYLWAWVFYVGAALAFYAVFWYWIRRSLWTEARQLLRVLLLVVLAVPWYTDPQQSYLSPAWLISIADLLLDGPNAFWRAGMPLVLGLIAGLVLSTLYSTFRWLQSRKKEVENQAEETA